MIIEMLQNKNEKPTNLAIDPQTKEPIILKKGRFGPYLQVNQKMKSLPPGITEDNITEEIAIKIISMPAEIGLDNKTNFPVIKDIGRYGPYIKCGSKNRKISHSDNILDITLKRALELLATDINDTAVLKELGEHEGKKIIIKNGRYGIYVTNGKVNVTIPKEDDYNKLELETAIHLIKNKKPKKKFYKRK